jgi:hypothetical protein
MLTSGICPKCGGETYRNIGGLYICKNSRGCGWHDYSFSLQPQPELVREDLPSGELTSSQAYIEKLEETFGYESEVQIYRLRKRLGDIKVEGNTSEPIIVTFYPSGGTQQLPVPPTSEDFQFVSGPSPRQRDSRLGLGLKHRKIVVAIDPSCSGNPLPTLFYPKS